METNVNIVVEKNGQVSYNKQVSKLPLFLTNVKVFRPSTFYIVIHTSYGFELEIELTPIMQVYIKAAVSTKGRLRGLCGDFNDVEADDFLNKDGLVEGTAHPFVNTWASGSHCHKVQEAQFCPVSIDTYAKYWCRMLSNKTGIFAPCHSEISPEEYESLCTQNICACEDSEACLCAAFSSYVHACAAAGVLLKDWRTAQCQKYTTGCPPTMVYAYPMTSCNRTCRFLGQSDSTCALKWTPLDGCGCAEGMYLNENGQCVRASQCPCYVGEKVASEPCRSGCVCPPGLLADSNGGCVTEDQCQCSYNGKFYQPGQTVTVDCNNCTCHRRKWECTDHKCDGTCTIYGLGNCRTFDDKKFTFNGECGYIIAQDYCGGDMHGSFRVQTENIPCGESEGICSTSIKLHLGNKDIVLSEESIRVTEQSKGKEIPYKSHDMGLYLAIEAKNGLVLIWNKKTSLMIKVSPEFKGKLCGLCGNYDGNIRNDFTLRNKEVVVEPLAFGNNWKVSPTCKDTKELLRPGNSYPGTLRSNNKHCGIFTSDVFASCRSKVDHESYYHACEKDTCTCNAGDCESFCSVVAAYAAACHEAGVCVKWRTPTICPVFCDFYNLEGECEWHYIPCGKPCMKTCKNPSGKCSNQIPALEGCYPSCPPEKPYLEEVAKKCVSGQECGCYDSEERHYEEGELMPSDKNCNIWI
ncbi:mucin-2-like [Brachionichthys hirsutus]|uniref:mucin-2-like n=1 Tax=Brachionichthys hirsutus TaxID=412623 RepID=UPI0036052279